MTGITQKRVLVTGATGFVGSHLAKRLVHDGCSVHLIVRSQSNLQQIKPLLDKVTLHEHDGSTERMHEIMGEVSPSIVFHLASLFLAQHEPANITALVGSNVLFATQLVDAMAARGISYLVNTGTSWQHFENKTYSPVNLYAATKQAFETILQYYVEATTLKVITLKLYDTYGPNDPRHKLFALLCRVAEEQTPLAMSPGEQLVDMVYIDDVVDAFTIAGERLLAGNVNLHESYAVSSGNQIKLKDLVDLYVQVVGQKLPIAWGGRPYRSREVMIPWNGGALLPGWKPGINLEEGIALMKCPGTSWTHRGD